MAGIAFEGGIDLVDSRSAIMDVVLGNKMVRIGRINLKPTTVVVAQQLEKTHGEETDGIDCFPVCVGVRHDCGCGV